MFVTIDSSWTTVAKNLKNDDCNNLTLKQYPKYRRQFCMNHKSGQIFTTKYFSDDPPPSGSLYRFEIVLKSYPFTSTPIIFSINIISTCDNMKNIYQNMSQICSPSGIYKQSLSYDNSKSSIPITINTSNLKDPYLSFIEVSVLQVNGTFIKGKRYGIGVNYQGVLHNTSFLYVPGTWIYSLQFLPTFKVVASKTMLLTLYTKFDIYEMSLFYLKDEDYCSQNSVCNMLAVQYFQQYKMHESECANLDKRAFISKYGFCLGEFFYYCFVYFNQL